MVRLLKCRHTLQWTYCCQEMLVQLGKTPWVSMSSSLTRNMYFPAFRLTPLSPINSNRHLHFKTQNTHTKTSYRYSRKQSFFFFHYFTHVKGEAFIWPFLQISHLAYCLYLKITICSQPFVAHLSVVAVEDMEHNRIFLPRQQFSTNVCLIVSFPSFRVLYSTSALLY